MLPIFSIALSGTDEVSTAFRGFMVGSVLIRSSRTLVRSAVHIIRGDNMTRRKVWLITGAGRGMGADFGKAVLGARHALVATGRGPRRVAQLLAPSEGLLAVHLEV